MVVEIDGRQIRSEADFHVAIAKALDLPSYYGRKLDALWDTLCADVERPVRLIWCDSSASQAEMSERFEKIVEILRKVERQDVEWNLPETERFEFVLN